VVSTPGISVTPAGPHLVRDSQPPEAKGARGAPAGHGTIGAAIGIRNWPPSLGILKRSRGRFSPKSAAAQDQPELGFSVSKLLAGIVQVLVLAALFFAYLQRGEPGWSRFFSLLWYCRR